MQYAIGGVVRAVRLRWVYDPYHWNPGHSQRHFLPNSSPRPLPLSTSPDNYLSKIKLDRNLQHIVYGIRTFSPGLFPRMDSSI